jgi:hypothetical protein
MKKNILLLLSIILFNQLLSQDTIKTSYKVDLTGIVNEVNGQSRTTLNFNLSNSIKWKKFESMIGTDYQLLSNDGTNAVNDFTVRLQPKIVDKKYSIFSFGQLSSLESKKITSRFEGGIGGGITLFKLSSLESTFSYGTLYYNNNFQDLTQRKGFRHSPRFQMYGKYEPYKISYSTEIFYQPAFERLDDYILRTKTAVGFDLNKKFTINLSYVTWFESYFVTGALNDVKTFTVGTTFKID